MSICNLYEQSTLSNFSIAFSSTINFLIYHEIIENKKTNSESIYLLLPYLFLVRSNRKDVFRTEEEGPEPEASAHYMKLTKQVCLCHLLRSGYFLEYIEYSLKQELFSILLLSGLGYLGKRIIRKSSDKTNITRC